MLYNPLAQKNEGLDYEIEKARGIAGAFLNNLSATAYSRLKWNNLNLYRPLIMDYAYQKRPLPFRLED